MTTLIAGFPRIAHAPLIMGGKACIQGKRVTVGMILGNLGSGVTMDDLLADIRAECPDRVSGL